MSELVEFMRLKGFIFKDILEIKTSELKIRNKLKLFRCTDLKKFYTFVVVVDQKSRVLQKDVLKYIEIEQKTIKFLDHNFKYRTIIIKAPLCSKAKALLKENSWKVYHDFS